MKNQSGFSLSELLVGIVVAGIVVMGAYKLFLFFNSQAVTQRRVANGQSELFPIQAALEKNLRRATYGIPMRSQRLIAGNILPVDAIVAADNGTNPDGIILRGNFTGVSTQMRSPFPMSATYMEVRFGATTAFAIGDSIVVQNTELSEYLRVLYIDNLNSRITTGARINSYPAGTSVTKVTTVEFRPSGADLKIITNGNTRYLSRNLADLRFYYKLQDGSIDSVAPVPIEAVKSIQYGVRIRIPKAGGNQYLYREAADWVLLRNTLL
jgi:prepilin-type N-terminal cleavage/methylation domain-containing protein